MWRVVVLLVLLGLSRLVIWLFLVMKLMLLMVWILLKLWVRFLM